MTRCLSLFLKMKVSELDLKQEMMDEEMEDLMEVQVWVRLGFCLKFLQAFRMRDRATITLEKQFGDEQ